MNPATGEPESGDTHELERFGEHRRDIDATSETPAPAQGAEKPFVVWSSAPQSFSPPSQSPRPVTPPSTSSSESEGTHELPVQHEQPAPQERSTDNATHD